MRAVKSIQDTFQLKSTVAVLGFSVRTLSEMIEDNELMETIAKFAKNNKNSSSPYKSVTSENKSKKVVPDPFARPVKNITSEEIQPYREENKEEVKEEIKEEVDDK